MGIETRHFTIQAPLFDGIVVPSPINAGWEIGWPLRDLNNNSLNRAVFEDRVGRFTPEILGRRPEAHSIALVWTDGPVAQGDGVLVRGSLSATEADPPNVIRRALTPIGLSPETATVLQLAPFDDLCVVIAGDDDTVTAHITVIDFSPGEAFKWFKDKNPGGGEDTCCTFTDRVIVDDEAVQLEGWVGSLFAHVTMEGAGLPVSLPSSTGLGVGARVLVSREGGDWFKVVPALGDRINDSAAVEGVALRDDDQAVLFELSAGGNWLATASIDAAADEVINNAIADAIVQLSAWAGDHCVRLQFIARGTLQLPDTASIAVGQRLFLYRGVGVAAIHVDLFDPFTERINGQLGLRRDIEGAGFGAVVERVPGGWTWVAVHELGAFNPAQTVNAAGTTLDHWAGDKVLFLAILGGGTTLLPALGEVPTGSRLWVFRTGGTLQHRLEAQPADPFNNVAGGGVDLVLNERFLEIVATDVGWVSTLPFAAAERVLAVGPVVLADAWVGIRTFSVSAGVTLTLPGGGMAIGSQALVRSPGIATINGGGNNIIFGGATAASINTVADEPILLTWSGGEWWGT